MTAHAGERGQATAEWVGLTLVAGLMIAALLLAAGAALPGTTLVHAIGERLVCAVRLADTCRTDPPLYGAYDPELADRVRSHAPTIVYERGMSALPVDFRDCRMPRCADGPGSGRVVRSGQGRQATAFTRVVDCREGAASAPGVNCTGPAGGNLYIQYWLYYADSATYRGVPVLEGKGFHLDDWESYAVRISPDGSVASRASSHNGYNGRGGLVNWSSDAQGKLPGASELKDATEFLGLRARGGWAPSSGRLYVSGGSHAGHASETELRRGLSRLLADATAPGPPATGGRAAGGKLARYGESRRTRLARAVRIQRALFGQLARRTPRGSLRLVPVEALGRGRLATRFAITPPWRKRVYFDPEYDGTD